MDFVVWSVVSSPSVELYGFRHVAHSGVARERQEDAFTH